MEGRPDNLTLLHIQEFRRLLSDLEARIDYVTDRLQSIETRLELGRDDSAARWQMLDSIERRVRRLEVRVEIADE
jgi:predicted  nucleic acid-binding Zn-ribbon protein